MPEFSGVLTEVKPIKQGEKDGRQWTLWGVWGLAQGSPTPEKFTTFDGQYADKVGQQASFQYTISQNGKFTDLRIVDPKKRGKGMALGPVMDRLTSIETKVDMIVDYIRERQKK